MKNKKFQKTLLGAIVLVLALAPCINAYATNDAFDIVDNGDTALSLGVSQDFDKTVGGFFLNTKQIADGDFISSLIQPTDVQGAGGAPVTNAYIVKLDGDGNIVWQSENVGDTMYVDLIETSSGNIITNSALMQANTDYNNIKVYDANGNKISENSDVHGSIPGGRSLFNFNGYYAAMTDTFSSDYDGAVDGIHIYLLNENGETVKSLIIDESSDAISNWSGLRSHYYGVTSDNEKIYFLIQNTDTTLAVLTVNSDLTYSVSEIDTSGLNTDGVDDNEAITKGMFTTLIKDGDDFYYATSSGIYSIRNGVVAREVDGANLGNPGYGDMEFTSIIQSGNYIIAGGTTGKWGEIGDSEAIIMVFDADFNLIDQVSLNDVYNVNDGTNLNIVKGLTLLEDGFFAGALLDGQYAGFTIYRYPRYETEVTYTVGTSGINIRALFARLAGVSIDELDWDVDDPEIANVEDSIMNALAVGSTDVKVLYNNVYYVIHLSVTPADVSNPNTMDGVVAYMCIAAICACSICIATRRYRRM